jgi:hypothetical protein
MHFSMFYILLSFLDPCHDVRVWTMDYGLWTMDLWTRLETIDDTLIVGINTQYCNDYGRCTDASVCE